MSPEGTAETRAWRWEHVLERSAAEGMLARLHMNVLFGIIALAGVLAAAVGGYRLNRRSQARRREEDRALAADEVRREAENLERVIEQLDALHQQTGFNVSASRAEAQKALEQLRRTDFQDDL